MTRLIWSVAVLRLAVRRAVLGVLLVLLLSGAAVALALSLAACGGPEAAAGPSAEERAILGAWAGQVDAQGVPLLLRIEFAEAKTYQVEIRAAGDLVERERGAWRLAGGRVYFAPATCDQADQVGGPLRPVTCEPGDSLAVNISGDTWPVHFTAGGELVSFELKRL